MLIEDVLRLIGGALMVVYFKASNDTIIHKKFNSKPEIAASLQRESGIAGYIIIIRGCAYLALKVQVYEAPMHHDAMTGRISKAQFEKLFKFNKGFSVEYCGTTISHLVAWRDIIKLAEDVLFFGPPY